MTRARGVTLVELVVTLTIALILLSAAVGGLVGVQTWRATSAVRRVHADLSYARARAMLSERRTLCTFDLGAQDYTLAQEPQPATGEIKAQPLPHPLYGTDWQVRLADLGGGVRVAGISGANVLGFGVDGQPVRISGQPIAQDVRIRFSTGAEIRMYGGSGLCEVVWP